MTKIIIMKLKYERVRQELLTRIESGHWHPGDSIPTEPELCAEFQVSRTTIRKAVGDLAQAGRLRVVQGKGTFVAASKLEERFVQSAFGIHEDLARRGIALSTRVLRQEVVPADSGLAARLRIGGGDPVQLVVRLRSVGGEPLLVSTTAIPAALAPDLERQRLARRSLYALLAERYGLRVAHGRRRLEAVAAGPQEAKLLDVALGSPLLLLESFAYLADGRPFEHSVTLQRATTRRSVEFSLRPRSRKRVSRWSGRPGARADRSVARRRMRGYRGGAVDSRDQRRPKQDRLALHGRRRGLRDSDRHPRDLVDRRGSSSVAKRYLRTPSIRRSRRSRSRGRRRPASAAARMTPRREVGRRDQGAVGRDPPQLEDALKPSSRPRHLPQ